MSNEYLFTSESVSEGHPDKIADQIHKDIVVILRSKVKDPRVSWITINDVEVDQEYSTARIYWSILDETKIDGATKALESAKGFIRSELSKGFKTYTIPHIKFIYDESISRGAKILNVINQVSQEFSTDEIDNDNNPST